MRFRVGSNRLPLVGAPSSFWRLTIELVCDLLCRVLSRPLINSLALTVLSAALSIVVFPQAGLWPLAWVALIPLFFALSGTSLKGAFLLGWLYGTIKSMGVAHWLFYAVYASGDLGVWVSLVFFVSVTVFFLAFYFAFFAIGATVILSARVSPWFQMIALPALWVAVEFARSTLFTGFPWGLLGHSQVGWRQLIQFADICGAVGISFLIVMVNTAIFLVIRHWVGKPVGLKFLLPVAVLLIAALVYGRVRVQQFTPSVQNRPGPGQTVAVVQSAIPQQEKWKSRHARRQLETYLQLTEQSIAQGAALVVWPETALSTYIQNRVPPKVQAALDQTDTALLIGAPAHERRGSKTVSLNSAYLVRGDAVVGRYDKQHLLPFSEYFPLDIDFLKMRYFGPTAYAEGTGSPLLHTPVGKVGTLICFEIIFSDLARRAVQGGAELLVNISNEAWFGNSGEHGQLLSIAAFKAVEFRRPVIRSGNTGISGFIDTTGHVVSSIPPFQQGVRLHQPGIRRDTTVYCRVGEAFSWLCVALSLIALVICAVDCFNRHSSTQYSGA